MPDSIELRYARGGFRGSALELEELLNGILQEFAAEIRNGTGTEPHHDRLVDVRDLVVDLARVPEAQERGIQVSPGNLRARVRSSSQGIDAGATAHFVVELLLAGKEHWDALGADGLTDLVVEEMAEAAVRRWTEAAFDVIWRRRGGRVGEALGRRSTERDVR